MTRRNFPDVWYKSKKKSHFVHRTCLDVLSMLFTFDALVEPVYSLGGWAGLNAPDNSVWKSPQVMTHLVEQACWMEEALNDLNESHYCVPFWTQVIAVQVRTCHFSHPPSLTSGRGLVVQLFHCGGRPRRVFLLVSFACLRSSLARGTRLGRCLMTRRNFPDVWYKSKK